MADNDPPSSQRPQTFQGLGSLRQALQQARAAPTAAPVPTTSLFSVTFVAVTLVTMLPPAMFVPVANLPSTLASDAGHLMGAGEPFAACYMDTPRGRIFSLRSTETGVDVSEIAARYGGGGHRHADGFQAAIGW